MDKMKACPFCGGKGNLQCAGVMKKYTGISTDYFVSCHECGTSTSRYFDTKEEAAAAWNRRPTPENKPLTLVELKSRNDPVWVPLEDGTGYWCLCQNGLIIPPSGIPFMAEDRLSWTFLNNKPELLDKPISKHMQCILDLLNQPQGGTELPPPNTVWEQGTTWLENRFNTKEDKP